MSIPTFKSFISEKEVEEVKKKRQEEWEKVRRPDQPLERPAEQYDPRTLYEKLKQQKDKKQEEWEEQFKFKNMIYKGLDDDEATFLTMVAKTQADHREDIIRREVADISEYREAVARLQEEQELTTPPPTSSKPSSSGDNGTLASPDGSTADHGTFLAKTSKVKVSRPQKSQLAIIAGSIKTKRKRNSSSDSVDSPEKKMKLLQETTKLETATGGGEAGERKAGKDREETSTDRDGGKDTTAGGLLGLVAYSSDSSDTDN